MGALTAVAAVLDVAIGRWWDRREEFSRWVRDRRFESYGALLSLAAEFRRC